MIERRSFSWLWCVACSLPLLLGNANSSVRAAPGPNAFGHIPRIDHVAISPDGKLLGWITNGESDQYTVIYDLAAQSEKRIIVVPPEMTARGIDWMDNETLLVELSITKGVGPRQRNKYEWMRIGAIDAGGGPMRILLMTGGARSLVTGANLLALRTEKPKTVLMASWDWAATKYKQQTGSRLVGGRKDDGWVYSLFEVDARTGKGLLLDLGTPYTHQWVVDAKGIAIVRSEWRVDESSYRVLRKTKAGGWSEIHRQSGPPFWLSGFSTDGTAIIAVGTSGESSSRVWSIPLDGSGAKVLLEDAERDVEFVVRDRYTWTPIGARLGGLEPQFTWFDDAAGRPYQLLARTFPQRSVEIFGRSEDGRRVIVRVVSPASPAVYYLVDLAKGTADIVGEEYPELADVALGEVRSITYAARDGARIPAYLTLPPGAADKMLPLVVLPHGGPESRDDPQFDWLSQFLATRGYAVLQPQFRGSTGFGEAHRKAGYRQWGGLMQDDITDGVLALAEQGLIDKARICIVGASYGGYAALAGAAFTPELYACAVSINGVSDLPSMLSSEALLGGKESNSLAYWKAHIGSPHDPDVIAKSPARAAENIRAPILLLHGVNDTVVPIAQADAMSKALRKLRKEHTYKKLSGEDHWLSRSNTRTQVLEELEAFLALYLQSPRH